MYVHIKNMLSVYNSVLQGLSGDAFRTHSSQNCSNVHE